MWLKIRVLESFVPPLICPRKTRIAFFMGRREYYIAVPTMQEHEAGKWADDPT
jgi:hypothetical protein